MVAALGLVACCAVGWALLATAGAAASERGRRVSFSASDEYQYFDKAESPVEVGNRRQIEMRLLTPTPPAVVYLSHVDNEDGVVLGTVTVDNIAYEKVVRVRYTGSDEPGAAGEVTACHLRTWGDHRRDDFQFSVDFRDRVRRLAPSMALRVDMTLVYVVNGALYNNYASIEMSSPVAAWDDVWPVSQTIPIPGARLDQVSLLPNNFQDLRGYSGGWPAAECRRRDFKRHRRWSASACKSDYDSECLPVPIYGRLSTSPPLSSSP
ncbi:CBM21 domain-containing protein [Plasmodiophora brassicae]|uniref:CBM21 domain-containing protein n=1 Tax=Plasmodiophora brassicae TaxID=37360 RepID=A0A0G4J2S6_PLABS|nr:hypothetical protein PBRA_008571 [Plasmodiophora brassicae]SPQ99467.1 unnamed protein product [Plasmodiophora brassicae]